MSKDKPNIDTEKNKLHHSEVSAGKNVHIGDVYTTIQNIEGEKDGREKGGRKGLFFSKFIGVTILSLTLVSVTIWKIEFVQNIFIPSMDTDNDKPEKADEKVAEIPVTIPPSKPVIAPIEKAKPPVKYVNTLDVKTNNGKYESLFSSSVSKMLLGEKIKFQANGNGNIANRIECVFDLQKSPTQSGVREAFKYSITLQVDIYSGTGQSCFSGFYSSKKERIGYPEDSEATMRKKIIEPALAEIKTDFINNPPLLCE